VIGMDTNTKLYLTVIIIFGGFVLIWVVYYFLKMRDRSDISTRPSVELSQKGGADKRQHPRMDINWSVSMETRDGRIDGEIKNISLGGAFICCKKPLPVGQVFPLTMIGPNNEPVAAMAEVAWSNVNVPDEKVINRGMGVRFIKMSERHIQLVRQVLKENE
jgi:uncharacterized protein (TIGR02266 family)